jgi:putative ABC transport system permease protein
VQLGGTNGEWYTVIGVVRDIRARGIGAPRTALPALYLSTQQVPPFTVDVAVRTELEPAAVAERVQAATREMPIAPPRDATTLNERLERALAPLRWFGALFALLALTAIALAVHGVHTLAHAWVAARRRELAIRAAIGATPFRLLRLVLTGITRIAAIGLALGVVAAWCAGRALQLRIAGLPPLDLSTAAPLAAALCLAALAGALWAAIRVVRSAPATAFRDLTQG